jgi:phosphoglycolate phosphatase
LRSLGAEPLLVYGGTAEITKPNLTMMIEMLKININHVKELPAGTDLLITVDCQRGAGNVHHFILPDTAELAVFDHHRQEIPDGKNIYIRSYLSSCSTLIWDLLNKEDFKMDDRIITALYYGLFMDTNGFSELRHPLDRDLAEVQSNIGFIKKLKNSAITMEELDIIGYTLRRLEVIYNIGIFSAEVCDANLLGFTSDIAQQVASIECCVVYCEQMTGLKLSIRSSVREIMASEIAAFICKETGNGGGNIDKAGGFMNFNRIKEHAGDILPYDYLVSKVNAYCENYDLIYADNNNIDFAGMPIYQKLPIPVGFVVSTDIFPEGSKITIRTLEGDIDAVAGENIYLMIGIEGEVYPILKEKFEMNYKSENVPYAKEAEYEPAIVNRFSGSRKLILPFAKTCVPKSTKLVRAKVVEKDTKVFSYWDTEKYFSGVKGDYLVANEGAYSDCYIVRRDIFLKT